MKERKDYLVNQEKEEALKAFLFDIDCLEKFNSVNKFNIFNTLKIARAEIRHSNVLAWLLDPNNDHGLGERILFELNRYIAKAYYPNDIKQGFRLLKMNFSDVIVQREWQGIDLLVESEREKYVLCIENKIDTQDHSMQLDRYYNIINEKYSDEYLKVFLYLTPEGLAPLMDSNDVWNSIRYEVLLEIIEKTLNKTNLSEKVEMFLKDYIEVLRRETVEDREIEMLCKEVYLKHRKALDLIFEHRPDRLQNIAEYIMSWCENKHKQGEIIYMPEKSSKSYCRFRLLDMDKILGEHEGLSGWGTKNHYFYEFASYLDKNGDAKICLQLAFSAANLTNTEKEIYKKIDTFVASKKTQLKENWQWRTVFKTRTHTVRDLDDLPEMVENNALFNIFDSMFENIIKEQEKINKAFMN